MLIRDYERADAAALADLRYRAVHALAANDYTPKQLSAWQPAPESERDAHRRYTDQRHTFVAEAPDGSLMGVTDLQTDGHIDTLYVHPDYAGRGVATALLQHVERLAVQACIARLYTEASATACPAFAANGFIVTHRCDFVHNVVPLFNLAMEKSLA